MTVVRGIVSGSRSTRLRTDPVISSLVLATETTAVSLLRLEPISGLEGVQEYPQDHSTETGSEQPMGESIFQQLKYRVCILCDAIALFDSSGRISYNRDERPVGYLD